MNELSTTPSSTNGEPSFTITHPFYPLCGHSFPLLSQSRTWGKERVFFADPQIHQIRSLPLTWTSLALPDPYLVVSSGKTVLRFEDRGPLNQMLKALPAHQKEDQEDDVAGYRSLPSSSGMPVCAAKYVPTSL